MTTPSEADRGPLYDLDKARFLKDMYWWRYAGPRDITKAGLPPWPPEKCAYVGTESLKQCHYRPLPGGFYCKRHSAGQGRLERAALRRRRYLYWLTSGVVVLTEAALEKALAEQAKQPLPGGCEGRIDALMAWHSDQQEMASVDAEIVHAAQWWDG